MRRASAFLRQVRDDRSGASTVLVGLGAVVLLGAAGLATDVAGWYAARRDAQHAADSAAFSAATAMVAGGSDYEEQAKAIVATYGVKDGQAGAKVTVTQGQSADGAATVQVLVEEPARRFFSRLFLTGARSIRASAVARVGGAGEGCVLALHPSLKDAVELSGSTEVRLNGCSLMVNSSNAGGFKMSGSSSLSAPHVLVGGPDWSRSGSFRLTTQDRNLPLFNRPSTADPYLGVREFEDFHGCDHRKMNIGGSDTHEFPAKSTPRIFCEGLTINGSAKVTFKPGIYVIDRGVLSFTGSSRITAERGSVFILTSSTGSNFARFNITGSTTVKITAPSNGDYAGLAIYQSRKAPVSKNDSDNTFTGSSDSVIEGAIYLPNQSLDYHGSTSQTSGCVQVIASTIKFTGSSGMALNCSGVGVRAIGGGKTVLVG